MGAKKVKEAVPVLSTHKCLKKLLALQDLRASGNIVLTAWSTPHHRPVTVQHTTGVHSCNAQSAAVRECVCQVLLDFCCLLCAHSQIAASSISLVKTAMSSSGDVHVMSIRMMTHTGTDSKLTASKSRLLRRQMFPMSWHLSQHQALTLCSNIP